MFDWEANGRRLHIREIMGETEYHEVEEIQREAWGFSDLDVVPMAHLVAARWAGGIVLGAFEGDRLIGFVYGFPGFEEGQVSIHSHMLAVRPDCRGLRAGLFLKLAQRERALKHGIGEITWTFDPLQSLNANLNFSRLGVVSRRYIVNFYGEATSSPLHQGFGTDRLWVSWLLESERVKKRIGLVSSAVLSNREKSAKREQGLARALVRAERETVVLADAAQALSTDCCLIEIPHDITRLKERNPERAWSWREATRSAFLAALKAGFLVEDLQRFATNETPRWAYVLRRYNHT